METEDKRPASRNLFEHPDVESLLETVMVSLVDESDRGAVLLAAVHVDECLKDLLSSVAPSGYAKKRQQLFGSLATRADAAFVGRLIGEPVYRSIQALRALRNSVAHEAQKFKLEHHENEVRRIFELGPDVQPSIYRMAFDVMMSCKIPAMMEAVRDLRDPSDETQPYFNSPHELLEYISDRPKTLGLLEQQFPRYKLAVGIWFIVAMLVWNQDAACALYGESGTAASVEAKLRRLQEAQVGAEA